MCGLGFWSVFKNTWFCMPLMNDDGLLIERGKKGKSESRKGRNLYLNFTAPD